MKVPLSWLNDYVEVDGQAEKLMADLTAIGHMQDGPPQDIEGDLVYDLEVRQNRSDCLSMLGIAREAAAVSGRQLKLPAAYEAELTDKSGSVTVEITDPKLCFRFQTLTFKNLKVGPSPDWLKKRLTAYGIKPINNVVDITNFVMVESGQPLHAFDLEKIDGERFVVRQAAKGEILTVLGNKSIALVEDDLIIASGQRPLALAGVIGGEASSVNNNTTTIVVEAANYYQATVRRSSLRHNLRTEASTRLEKFLHPKLTQLALARVAQLLTELAEGELVGQVDNYPTVIPENKVNLRLSYLNQIAGIDFSADQTKELLAKVHLPADQTGNDTLTINVPYFRTDIEQEADLVEEVLRIYGYDRIPEDLPAAPPPQDIQSKNYIISEKIRDYLVGLGYHEQITEPLTDEQNPVLEPVILENSLTSEKRMLRTSLIPMLVRGTNYRRKHHYSHIKIFEVGKIYYRSDDQYLEKNVVGVIALGNDARYRQIKGDIEEMIIRLGYQPDSTCYSIEKVVDFSSGYVAQLDLDTLLKSQETKTTQVLTSPPQVIFQDLSLLVPVEIQVGDLLDTIKKVSQLIYQVKLGEEPQLIDGQKSVFIKLTYHDPQQAISLDTVRPIRDKVVATLEKQYQAKLRLNE